MTTTNTELHPGLTKNPPPIAGWGEGREDKKKGWGQKTPPVHRDLGVASYHARQGLWDPTGPSRGQKPSRVPPSCLPYFLSGQIQSPSLTRKFLVDISASGTAQSFFRSGASPDEPEGGSGLASAVIGQDCAGEGGGEEGSCDKESCRHDRLFLCDEFSRYFFFAGSNPSLVARWSVGENAPNGFRNEGRKKKIEEVIRHSISRPRSDNSGRRLASSESDL